jgi:hypothetical protein
MEHLSMKGLSGEGLGTLEDMLRKARDTGISFSKAAPLRLRETWNQEGGGAHIRGNWNDE